MSIDCTHPEHSKYYECPNPQKEVDPRDPDYSRKGIFIHHNCYRCNDGTLPCVRGNPNSCEFPHARND